MFKIGDFSRLSRVSVKALRYYDQIDLLKPAHIDPFTAYRYYTAEQLPHLNRILALKDLGLSLDEVREVLGADLPPDQLGDLLRRKRDEIARQVAEERARLARVEALLRQIEQDGVAPEYEVVLKPLAAQSMLGIRATLPGYEAVEALFYELETHYRQHAGCGISGTDCLTIYYDPEHREQDVDVLCAAPLPGDDPGTILETERIRRVTIPAEAQVASVIYRGPYQGVDVGYAAILRWIAANHYAISGPNRMVYLQGPGAVSDPADYITEIQFPVQSENGS